MSANPIYQVVTANALAHRRCGLSHRLRRMERRDHPCRVYRRRREHAEFRLSVAEGQTRLVVDAHLAEVEITDHGPVPVTRREALRAAGPSIALAPAPACPGRHRRRITPARTRLPSREAPPHEPDPYLAERSAQFRAQVARRLSGELTEEEFKPLRLMNGVYLQLHAYMLRVAIPYGTLSSADQMRVVGRAGQNAGIAAMAISPPARTCSSTGRA